MIRFLASMVAASRLRRFVRRFVREHPGASKGECVAARDGWLEDERIGRWIRSGSISESVRRRAAELGAELQERKTMSDPIERLRSESYLHTLTYPPYGQVKEERTFESRTVDLGLAEQVVTELQAEIANQNVALMLAEAEVERLRGALAEACISCGMDVGCSVSDDIVSALASDDKQSSTGAQFIASLIRSGASDNVIKVARQTVDDHYESDE